MSFKQKLYLYIAFIDSTSIQNNDNVIKILLSHNSVFNLIYMVCDYYNVNLTRNANELLL